MKNVLEIHRVKELIDVIEYQNIFGSNFCQKWSNFGQIFMENGSDSQSDFRKFYSDSSNIYTGHASLH